MCSCDDDHEYVLSGQHEYAGGNGQLTVTRRDLLRGGAAAVIAGGAAAVVGQATAAAQGAGGAAPLPRPIWQPFYSGGVVFWGNNIGNFDPASFLAERQGPSRTTGMKFKALVRHENALTTETLTLLPLHPLHVVIRMQAAQTCYSTTSRLDTTNRAEFAGAAGHGGVGIVEEVGRAVKRVKVGDQVVVAITSNCGVCANCLAFRADYCTQRLPAIPSATMSGKIPVYLNAAPGGPAGYSEIVVSDEEWLVPVFTKVPPAELSLLSCVAATGLGMAMCRFPIEAGTEVAVFGLGPIGISAVQGARIQGAKTIIGIDPIKYRRELALKLGATHVLDPNVHRGNDLIFKIRELTADVMPEGRRYAGERQPGPTYVLEAVGGTRFPLPASVESPIDMTGIEPLQQAWTVTRNAGYLRTSGAGHPPGANVTIPGSEWANGGKTHVPGNYAGVQAMRDIPRFVRLIESGLFDAKSLVGQVFRPDKMREALQVAADRTAITSVIDFT